MLTTTARLARTGTRRVAATGRALAWRLVAVLLAARRRLTAVRVRAHLRRTERALRAADTDHLDAERRRRREQALDALREYRRRGAVPTNEGTPERAPRFVGANGVPCAVAALALAHGERDLVERVAASENDLRAEDLCGGGEPAGGHRAALCEWLETTGLTRNEAARIQPAYPSEVLFATDCGPVSCVVARTLVSVVALGVFAASEVVGYRLAGGVFPENPFKRRGTLAYLTVVNCLLAPLAGLVLYALFP